MRIDTTAKLTICEPKKAADKRADEPELLHVQVTLKRAGPDDPPPRPMRAFAILSTKTMLQEHVTKALRAYVMRGTGKAKDLGVLDNALQKVGTKRTNDGSRPLSE